MKKNPQNTFQPFPVGSHLIAYLRDSGGNDQDLSVEQQEAALRKWCIERGYILEHVFKDVAKPGSSVVGRSEFQQMMRYFRSKDCTAYGVILWKYSRFARDFDDAQFYKSDIRRRGYTIYSLQDQIPDGPDGRFFEAALDWMNSKFLEDLSDDVSRALNHNVEQYGVVPGIPPRGFKRELVTIGTRRDGKPHIVAKWVPDPNLWEMCRLAWKMRAEGASYAEINKVTGLYASLNSYPTFFKNKLYLGILEYGDLIIENYCEPLIDQTTWDRVQAINNENAKASRLSGNDNPDHPRRQSPNFPLSGLVYCALCESLLNGNVVNFQGQHIYLYYQCGCSDRTRKCHAKKIPADVLEKAISDTLINLILDSENIAACKAQFDENVSAETEEMQTQREILKHRLILIQRKIKNIVEAISTSGVGSRSLTATLSELEKEETEIQTIFTQLEIQAGQNSLTSLALEKIQTTAERIRAILPKLDNESKRLAFHSLIDRVVVQRDGRVIRGTIEYYFPPDDSGIYYPSGDEQEGGDNEIDENITTKSPSEKFMSIHHFPMGAH